MFCLCFCRRPRQRHCMSGDKRTIQLLWTAGWDSTFRLLMALRVYRIAVQPYYLIHFTRRSTANELRAMQQISRGITARYPELAGLLHQPIISTVAEIGADPVITERFERLRTRSHLGEQYDWLARFASQRNLNALEIAVHQDDKAAVFLQPYVVPDEIDGDRYFRLCDNPSDNDLRLFQQFRFPIFSYTKLEMQRVAREHGFAELMEMTWFCYSPTRRMEPCGRCNPCRYTAEEGLSRRIPRVTRLRVQCGRLLRRARKILRR